MIIFLSYHIAQVSIAATTKAARMSHSSPSPVTPTQSLSSLLPLNSSYLTSTPVQALSHSWMSELATNLQLMLPKGVASSTSARRWVDLGMPYDCQVRYCSEGSGADCHYEYSNATSCELLKASMSCYHLRMGCRIASTSEAMY
jgi:hypothetical protein